MLYVLKLYISFPKYPSLPRNPSSASNSHTDSKQVSPPSVLSVCLSDTFKNHSAGVIKHLNFPTEQHDLGQVIKARLKMTAVLLP